MTTIIVAKINARAEVIDLKYMNNIFLMAVHSKQTVAKVKFLLLQCPVLLCGVPYFTTTTGKPLAELVSSANEPIHVTISAAFKGKRERNI